MTTLLDALAALPEDAPAYVPGVGEVTVGEIRAATEETPGVDDQLARLLPVWVLEVTKDLCEHGEWAESASSGDNRSGTRG